MAFVFKIVQIAIIKSLINNYIDLRMAAIDMASVANENTSPTFAETSWTSPYKIVKVLLPRKTDQHVFAKVSPEDYEKVTRISKEWRKSSSGYAIHVVKSEENPKSFKTFYMHRVIFGAQAKHVNGDRLDNRRENLVYSRRKRKICAIDTSEEDLDLDFEIKGPRVVDIQFCTFSHNDTALYDHTGYAVVKYEDRMYSGMVKSGIPHGYGKVCTGSTSSYEMIGNWVEGKIDLGIMVYYHAYPDCWCVDADHLCPERRVKHVELVSQGYRIPSGSSNHEDV